MGTRVNRRYFSSYVTWTIVMMSFSSEVESLFPWPEVAVELAGLTLMMPMSAARSLPSWAPPAERTMLSARTRASRSSAATKVESAEVGQITYDGYYSTSKTCEIALSEAVGHNYESILNLLDEVAE